MYVCRRTTTDCILRMTTTSHSNKINACNNYCVTYIFTLYQVYRLQLMVCGFWKWISTMVFKTRFTISIHVISGGLNHCGVQMTVSLKAKLVGFLTVTFILVVVDATEIDEDVNSPAVYFFPKLYQLKSNNATKLTTRHAQAR